MGAVRVTTPAGVAWTVRRRWIPHREGIGVRARFARRRRERRSAQRESRWYDGLDIPDLGTDLDALAVIVVVLFGWPLALIGIDLVWFLLVGVFGTIGRVVLRRPWRVEARSSDERRDWFVPGFRAASRHRDEIARQLRHGQNPLGDRAATLTH